MSDDDDVLLVNVGSGLTAAHIASLSHNSSTNIYAYGITSDRHQKNVNKLLEHLGVRCTHISCSLRYCKVGFIGNNTKHLNSRI